ncbi:MAG: hypothetical protein DCF26_10975 [Burkholderiales bacterium]|nr:MAG: hypothetical protein DCF26_10975 [Burkholderiales bacterium]
MFVWLSLIQVPGGLVLSSRGCELDTLAAPESNVAVLKERRNAVMKVIVGTRPELKGSESSRVYNAVANTVRCLPSVYADLDFAIHLSVAHFCLPEPQRSAREQAIDTIIERYFGPTDSRRADVRPQLDVLRTQMILLPDEMFEFWISSHCGLLLSETLMDPFDAKCDPKALGDYVVMNTAVSLLAVGALDKRSISTVLGMTYCLFPPSRRESLINLVMDPSHHTALPLLVRADDVLVKRVPSLTPLHRARALVNMLSEVVAQGLDCNDPRADDIIEAQAVQTQSHIDRFFSRARDTTLAALKTGAPMGTRGIATRTTLLNMRMIERKLNIRLNLTRTNPVQTGLASKSPQADTTDMEPVHAWSVARLVRWIEGPLTERSTRGRLNRQTVVAQEKAALQQDAKELRAVGLTADAAPAALTEDEVGQVMTDALAATARFFQDDIREMVPLAKMLGAAATQLERCIHLQEPLQALSNRPANVDEEKARALLNDAEICIDDLRKSIKVAEAAMLLVNRFSARFLTALATEPMVLGKRHGGVIDCPLKASDWPWVAQMFHRRWLPRTGSLLIDGESIALQPDQALALYVTGSSQSNFAFDVSVHLWQRRAGRTSPPSEGDELYPTMNETDWFDTYVPCAVLHVPPAV